RALSPSADRIRYIEDGALTLEKNNPARCGCAPELVPDMQRNGRAFGALLADNVAWLSIHGASGLQPRALPLSSISIRRKRCCRTWRANFMSAPAKSAR